MSHAQSALPGSRHGRLPTAHGPVSALLGCFAVAAALVIGSLPSGPSAPQTESASGAGGDARTSDVAVASEPLVHPGRDGLALESASTFGRAVRGDVASRTLLRTPVSVRVRVGGQVTTVVTTTATVKAMLREAGIPVHDRDMVLPGLAARPTAGGVVQVIRVSVRARAVDRAVPYATVERPDASLKVGTSMVVQEGRAGLDRLRYRVVRHDGEAVWTRYVGTVHVRAATDRIIAVGAKPADPGPRPDADGLNWSALANCESGGNPHARSGNGVYFGLYQFSLGTWASVGGSGSPADASSDEQTYRAQLLYKRSGASPWPTCGYLLHT